jgi:hypothetical protein
MVKYKEHGNVLADDYEDSSVFDEEENDIYVENLYNKDMIETKDGGSLRPNSALGSKLSRTG